VHGEHPVASREIAVFSGRLARTLVVTIDERLRCGLIAHAAAYVPLSHLVCAAKRQDRSGDVKRFGARDLTIHAV
jgi:hypothetical protein